MSIAIHIHGGRNDAALAELIASTMIGAGATDVFAKEPELAQLSAVVAADELEADKRRAAWRWLNSLPSRSVDPDNDWSQV